MTHLTPFYDRPLNPLRCRDDVDLICPVDGWRTVKAEVLDFLSMTRPDMPATVFVVSGPSGTGRTSLAYYLAHLWQEGQTQRCALPLVHSRPMAGYKEDEELWKWCTDFLSRMRSPEHLEEWRDQVTDATKECWRALATSGCSETTRFAVGELAQYLVADLGKQQRGLVAIFEDVKTSEMVVALKESFQYVDACFILVVDDTSRSPEVMSTIQGVFGEQHHLHLELCDIAGGDVQLVADHRWQVFSVSQPHPFATILDGPFRKPPRSLRLVLMRLRGLLGMVQVNPPPVLSADWVRDVLRVLDDQRHEA